VRVLLTTDAGLEDVAAAELAEIVPEAVVRETPRGSTGMVYADAGAVDGLLRLSTIYHVYEIRGEAEVRTLDDVRSAVACCEFPELPGASSFRVSADRRGEHPFTRVELAA
jgi:tRNA(Ser,Leu) C12 N-acetylase TAN1